MVDQFGLFLKGFVDFEHRSAHGRDKVAGSLYAFHCTEIFGSCHLITLFGHIHIDHIAQLFLCIVRDTDVTNIAFYSYILVTFAVVKSFNYFCHSYYLIKV